MNIGQIKIIENKESFDNIYEKFYESSLISINPNLHLIGLDCEYICEANYPESFENSKTWVIASDKVVVCKLQLATKTMCLLIDLCKFSKELPDQLINILVCESWIKCGVGISNDMKYLSTNFSLGQCNGVYDIKTLAMLANVSSPNLENIYSSLYSTNYEKIKRHSLSDWSKDMTVDMIRYAAEDAFVSYHIGMKLFQILKNSLTNTFGSISNKKENAKSYDIVLDTVDKQNHIGRLQEHCQKNSLPLPTYESIKSDNSNAFCFVCKFDDNVTKGYDNNKQGAKQNAALAMLEKLKF